MYKALILCNSTFPQDPASLPALHGPRKDGLILWRALTDQEFGLFDNEQVDVMCEFSSYEARCAIEELFASATIEDVLLLYYSGHGRRYSGELVLCFRDTQASKLQSTGIPCGAIRRMLEASPAKAVIIILDCCYAAAFKGEPAVDELAGEGIYIISAAGAAEIAHDASKGGQPSPFTQVLTQALFEETASRSSGLTLDSLYQAICHRITTKQPRPWKSFDGTGILTITDVIAPTVRQQRMPHDTNRLDRVDSFDRLVANLSQPTPKFGAEERLMAMEEGELFDRSIKVLNEILRGEKDPHDTVKVKERRLIARIRSILVGRMPESGEALSAHIQYLIQTNKFREASRFISFVDKDLAAPQLLSFYKTIIEAGEYAGMAGQILEDVNVKYRIDLVGWQLNSLNVTDTSWGHEVRFEGLDLSNSSFDKIGFYGSRLTKSNLRGSVFTGCSFHHAAFDASDLRGAKFLPGTGWRDRVSMTGTKLQGCNLEGSTFENVYTFYESRGRGRAEVQLPTPGDRLCFKASNLSRASFLNCDLRGADLSQCQGLQDAEGWSGTRIYGVLGIDEALMEVLVQRGAINHP